MGDDEQRPCARGERCAEATVVREGGKTVRQPALGPRAFCVTDENQIVRSLEQFPDYHTRLAAALGDKLTAQGERVSSTRWSAPIPINTTVEALMVDLVLVVASWCERVDDVAKLSGRSVSATKGGYAPPWAVEDMCQILTSRVGVLLSLPPMPMTRHVSLARAAELLTGDGGDVSGMVHIGAEYVEVVRPLGGEDAGLEALRLNARCRGVLGLSSRDVEIPTVCWDCDNKGGLYRPDGAAGLLDAVHCRHCYARYEGERFERLMAHVEAEQARKPNRRAS